MSSIVVAFTHKSFGIGKNGSIPWNIREDRGHFAKLTKGHVVIMGRNTFESIGNQPLSERFNIVVTSKKYEDFVYHNLFFCNDIENAKHFKSEEVFYIGGTSVYQYALDHVDTIYATVIEKEYDCDVFFPTKGLEKFEICEYSPRQFSEKEQCYYRFIVYKRSKQGVVPQEQSYINLLRDIIDNGEERPDRTGVGTKAVFARQLRFDLSNNSMPVLTTKQLAWKTVLKELLWFLKGDCDSKTLEKQGVKIWTGNTSREFLDKRGLTHYKEGDMGPLYSHSIRHFGARYEGCDKDYTGRGFDQLAHIINELKTDPYSRRHLMTTFNPSVVHECVLMPCHGIAIQFYVSTNKKLSCHVYCRSSDVFLGLSFNIASYAFLTHIIAKKTGLESHELVISTGDTHLYANHIEQAKEQIQRNILPSPVLNILRDREFEEMDIDDFELVGYLHNKPIVAPMAV